MNQNLDVLDWNNRTIYKDILLYDYIKGDITKEEFENLEDQHDED